MNDRRPATNAELQREMEELRETVAELSASIESLVKAWENANFLVAVVKWLAGMMIALSGLWYVFTHFGEKG